MNGLLIFITLVISAAVSGDYRLPLPGVYQTGHEMVITAESGCEYRDIEPLEDVAHEIRQITPWMTGITFHEPGFITGLEIKCVHSIYESEPDHIAVDWMIR